MLNWISERSKCSLEEIPHDMETFFQMAGNVSIREYFLIDGETFIFQVPTNCETAGKSVALLTQSGFERTCESGHINFDGTFKFFPSFIYQLFILLATVNSHVNNIKYLLKDN